jgi:competence protein ComEA
MLEIARMPTPSEQKALAFVAIVILLGGAARVVRAGSSPEATPLEQQALARQAGAADSASARAKAKKGRYAKNPRSRQDTLPKVVGGVASVPRTFARPDAPDAHTPYGTRSEQLGFPPPSERIDIAPGGQSTPRSPELSAPARKPGSRAPSSTLGTKVDMDRATAAEIEALPRIGPALARRIVANRDSLGPFLSLANLRRVKGMGPATVQLLEPLVTFGGRGAGTRSP